MKKILALLLALSMVFVLCGCGGQKASTVTIDELIDQAIVPVDKKGTLTKTPTDKGYTFTYEGKVAGSSPFVLEGTDNDKEQLYGFTVTMSQPFDADYLMSCTKLDVAGDISDWQNVPMNKVIASFFLAMFTQSVTVLSKGEKPEDGTLSVFLDARGGKNTFAGWEYGISVDKSAETATITANYVG